MEFGPYFHEKSASQYQFLIVLSGVDKMLCENQSKKIIDSVRELRLSTFLVSELSRTDLHLKDGILIIET